MPIQSITQNANVSAKTTTYEAAPKSTDGNTVAKNVQAETIVKAIPKQDNYTKNEDTRNVTYQNPKALSADDLRTINDQRVASFKTMIQNMMGTQAKASGMAVTDPVSQLYAKYANLEIATDPAGAAKAIAEDGPWGIDAVATRIMDMAVALSGGDTSKLELLKGAVEDGFKAAGAAFGSDLPSISQNTYKEVMNRFDYWKENGSMDNYKYGGDKQFNVKES